MIKRLDHMLNPRRAYVFAALLAIVIALPVGTAFADDEEPAASSTPVPDALARDAQEYASEWGLGLQEAKRRLGLQRRIGQLDADLTTNEASTFAGLWIQHGPEFGIIAKFTRDGEATVLPYVTGGPLAGMVEIRTADTTLEGLKAAQESAMLAAGPLGVPVESGINVFENRVELYVVERARFDQAVQNAGIQLPSKVQVITVDQLSKATSEIYGGLALSPVCTSGFSVRHWDGRRGITTAAHCQTPLSYNGTTLSYRGRRIGGSYDIEWFTTPGFTVRNWAWDGTNNRFVTATKHRNQQAINEWVCKYGKITLYGCGYIIDKNYLQDSFISCPKCTGLPTWIRVHRDGVNLASPGDSGGPWFLGNTAYGIMNGKFGNDAIYMAINYLSSAGLGITVLTN